MSPQIWYDTCVDQAMASEVMSLSNDEIVSALSADSLCELSKRWRRARFAALGVDAVTESAQEEEALCAVPLAGRETALRVVFDNSRRLSQSFARFHRVVLEMSDMPALIHGVLAPCFAGDVARVSSEEGIRLERGACAFGAHGPFGCDFFREAISGLTLGLTEGVLHARHESVGHGQARCVDVFYSNPESALRVGPIPPEWKHAIDQSIRIAGQFNSCVTVRFVGMSEGTLAYVIEGNENAEQPSIRRLIERQISKNLPGVVLRELSARSVMGPTP